MVPLNNLSPGFIIHVYLIMIIYLIFIDKSLVHYILNRMFSFFVYIFSFLHKDNPPYVVNDVNCRGVIVEPRLIDIESGV